MIRGLIITKTLFALVGVVLCILMITEIAAINASDRESIRWLNQNTMTTFLVLRSYLGAMLVLAVITSISVEAVQHYRVRRLANLAAIRELRELLEIFDFEANHFESEAERFQDDDVRIHLVTKAKTFASCANSVRNMLARHKWLNDDV